MNLIQVRQSESLCFRNQDISIVFDMIRSIYNKDYETFHEMYKDKTMSTELGLGRNGSSIHCLSKIPCINFIFLVKTIPRGDEMKRPNNLFQKKYISSLVIAAFLILSVLTAYNIKIGNADGGKSDNKTKTETTEKSNDVIGPVSGNDTGSATNSADSAANNDMDVEPGAEGQNGTDTLDSNAEDNGEGTKYSNNSGRNSSSEQDDADTKDENNTKNNISGTKENAENNAENSGASGDSVYNYNGKKKLTWPVMGNIILPYSMDATVYYTTLDQYACNDGIIVGAKVGEEVVSPANGRVVNIEDTDRYGKVVTILLGNYYKAYCGQLDNVDYEIGDDIQEGDVLGTVAEPTKSFVLEGPNVFFKMTYKDKTVNPVKYLRV